MGGLGTLADDDDEMVKEAVMVENAIRLAKAQLGDREHIKPSALYSANNAAVQAVFAEQLGISIDGMGKQAAISALNLKNEELMDARALKDAEAADKAAKGGSKETSNGGKTAGVVILIFVLIGVGVGMTMYVRMKRQQAGPRHKGFKNTKYESNPGGSEVANPTFAGGTPSWADASVPFLSKEEAIARIQNGGSVDKSFVVRQSTSVVKGYVITSVNQGKFSNIQLKRQGNQLNYGSKSLGTTLSEAIRTLKTTVPITPKDGSHYFLGFQAGDAEC